MKELTQVLQRFEHAAGFPAVVWTQPIPDGPLVVSAGAEDRVAPGVLRLLGPRSRPAEVTLEDGYQLVAGVPGNPGAWLGLGPFAESQRETAVAQLQFLLPVVAHYFQSDLIAEHSASELAERYEEINLLYTTSEILGRTVSLEDAAARILREISDTVGARRAAILTHDRTSDTLQPLSVIGFDPAALPPIETQHPVAVTAFVFRERHGVLLDAQARPCQDEAPLREGGFLAVPILWSSPGVQGAAALGVLTLADRRNGVGFSRGEEKLISAIATQIGTAIQNTRLVRSSLAQQRLQQEMQLANDLQLKLLPDARLFAPEAQIAARVVSAESVGGDFYQLFRLSGGRTGVMVGDVSSHGIRAALIMALVMSASSIHAQASDDPAEVLDKLLLTLKDELESTEMFISIFYGVIDPVRGKLRYANAGHPHAFVMNASGSLQRLRALDPPLGMTADRPGATERAWSPNRDLLFLFTDGVADARNNAGVRIGEQRILELVHRARLEDPQAIVDQVFAAVSAHAGDAPRRDDLTLLVGRS